LTESTPSQQEILRKSSATPIRELVKQVGYSKQYIYQLKKRWPAWVITVNEEAGLNMAVKVRKSRRPTREVIVCFRVSAAECNSIKALGAQRGLKKSTSPNRICLCLDRSSTTPQTKEIHARLPTSPGCRKQPPWLQPRDFSWPKGLEG
jgi:ActR/RegA family two-component response regulator